MSHLARPRLHFQGKIRANVTTANNDDVLDIIDVETGSIYRHDSIATDTEFRQWATAIDPDTAMDPAKEKQIRAGWNYYGSGSCRLEEVRVTSFQFLDHTLDVSQSAESHLSEPVEKVSTSSPINQSLGSDPLIGARVEFNKALMIDVDPESIFSSQIFWDRLHIKDEQGQTLLHLDSAIPFYSCWHHSWRNLAFPRNFTGASAVWYAAIPYPNLYFDQDNASPALRELHQAARDSRGLFIRFCTYFFQRTFTAEALVEQFKQGNFSNPAYGHIIGTIGPWDSAEMGSLLAMGRLLSDANALPYYDGVFSLGPALAKVIKKGQDSFVALDLISTFPEGDESLEKVPLGEFSLQLRHQKNGQQQTAKMKVPYHKSDYEANGGIIEILCPPELVKALEEDKLLLFADKYGFETLQETDLTIAINQLGFYLQEGEENNDLELHVLRRGQLVPEPVQLKFEQYIMTNIHRADKKAILPTKEGSSEAKKALPEEYIVEVKADRMQDDVITVEPGGVCRVTLKGKKRGTCIIRFVDARRPAANFMQRFTTSFFVNVRVFPADQELAETPDEDLTFPFIFEKVLRYFYLLYSPNNHHPFDFAKETQVKKCAEEIKEHINKPIWDVDYMPRTRDLSAGKRKLLDRWCDKVIAEEPAILDCK